MGYFKPCALQRVRINGIGVVLGSDFDFSVGKVFYRVVSAAVSEFKLVCLCAVGEAYKLVTEAYSAYRVFAPEFLNKVDDLWNILRVSGAV